MLNVPESLPVSEHKNTLSAVQDLIDAGKITKLYGGHGNFHMDVDIVQKYLKMCDNILSGNLSEQELKQGSHTYGGLTISFKPDEIQ